VNDEIENLKKKKHRLDTDKESPLEAADNYTEKAEHPHQLT